MSACLQAGKQDSMTGNHACRLVGYRVGVLASVGTCKQGALACRSSKERP